MDTNKHESEDDSLPLEFRALKIEQDPNAKFRDPEIIEHLAPFM